MDAARAAAREWLDAAKELDLRRYGPKLMAEARGVLLPVDAVRAAARCRLGSWRAGEVEMQVAFRRKRKAKPAFGPWEKWTEARGVLMDAVRAGMWPEKAN